MDLVLIAKFLRRLYGKLRSGCGRKKGIAINVIAHGCHDKYREGKYHWEEIHLPNSNENGPQWIDWFIYGKHPLFDTYEEVLLDGLSQMLELIKKGE